MRRVEVHVRVAKGARQGRLRQGYMRGRWLEMAGAFSFTCCHYPVNCRKSKMTRGFNAHLRPAKSVHHNHPDLRRLRWATITHILGDFECFFSGRCIYYIPGPSNRSPPATFKSTKASRETCWRVLVLIYIYIYIPRKPSCWKKVGTGQSDMFFMVVQKSDGSTFQEALCRTPSLF